MNIFNIRYGHACNSSSSHSLIWTGVDLNERDEDCEFGWQYFTAADEESRRRYACILVRDALSVDATNDWETNNKLSEALTKIVIGEDNYKHLNAEGEGSAYIDHESGCDEFHLDTKNVNSKFIQEFIEWFAKAPIAVLGGNDNDDQVHPLADVYDNETYNPNWIYSLYGKTRYDEVYKYWTVFNPINGTKLRINFNDVQTTPTRSSSPELIDMKITDYCPFGCTYCYQGSTISGKHGDFKIISSYIREAAEAKVFEIAFGGGEPTLHPEFSEIIELCSRRGINANFTTKNLAWLKNTKLRDTIFENCKAFAFSVEKPEDIEKLDEVFKDYKLKIVCNLQVIVGLTPENIFKEILLKAKKLGYRITLLGWKNHGRANAQPYVFDWLAIAKEIFYTVAIDTVLAKTLDSSIDPRSYHTQEGAWSMYIDAVENYFSASSYSDGMKIPSLTYERWDNEKKWPKSIEIKKPFSELIPE